MIAPVQERQPTIEWQVAGACNYDCSYCIQSAKYRKGRPDAKHLWAAIDFFAALPGTWELKMSGGEAFAHPLFMKQVVPALIERTSHRLSVLTNFSADHRTLMEFAQRTRDRLEVFSASLHLEHVDAEAFAAKAEWFVSQLSPSVRFVVNQVVRPGHEAEAARCRDLITARGLRWFPQLEKRNGRVTTFPNGDAIVALIGRRPAPREANIAPSYKGRVCHAGVDYFVVDKDGEAYSCRTAKRHGQGHLGSVFDGSARRAVAALPCVYDVCPCTVPANRGMIEGISPQASATDEDGEVADRELSPALAAAFTSPPRASTIAAKASTSLPEPRS